MVPQILQQLGGGQNILGMIKQAKAALGSVSNPEAMLTQIVNNTPIVKRTIAQYGSVDNAINALCQQKGIDPQEFMAALR